MCRHLAYLGPPIPLADLLFTPPHSLERQSWAPRDMRGGGTINADGFGIGWFQAQEPVPLRYRRSAALWTDSTLPQLAAATRSGCVLAAVRSATVGMPVVETAAAPFTEDRWLFSHNGKVTGWPDSVAALAAALPVRDLLTLDAPTDSALLWALVRDRLRAGLEPGKALAEVVTAVRAAAPGSRLNLLLTDGESIAATTAGHSLSYLATGDGAVLVASEPLTPDAAWTAVPDLSLLVAAPAAVAVIALEGQTS
ncbi:ergothioneine biosynthesis protein EgtC [Dactylosporangium matsuzakiense]|uniref:Gamma-glutamyl-hercynylcysteine sulfoxide hydrolase n=1 Tax=Dactylosporangium matsuzakiense TaxID=53360 RepID=A0A9W6NP36_9ACTN|nr:ergothioneine biosynthesis protein EgtC [Dactylosporangium matsuzakiense]UWZ42660.1 ergothioneine biosynthesis protein EgtC [Dactylosporangium matsuzakiense]GLL03866.1 gamma-glutamyl-hercynylcysteine sulfoxide hydrolase [Dactylosporangium matsuzakiense]